MNSRVLLGISFGLNLVLAAAIFLWPKPSPPSGRINLAPAPLPIKAVESEPLPAPAATAVTSHFDWSQLMSPDLKTYRDNLVAFGCPPSLMRLIIMSEINDRFGKRRQALVAGLQSQFWNFAIRGQEALRDEWGKPLEDLTVERRKTIDEILGKEESPTEFMLAQARLRSQQRYAWLPSAKRDQIVALEEKYRQARAALAATSSLNREDRPISDANKARLKELDQQLHDAKAAVLTPEEMAEADLRSSHNASWASSLSGFQVTQAEWEAVTKLRNDFDQAESTLQTSSLSESDRAEKIKAMGSALDQATKDALGAEEYSQYELARNDQFQDAYKITQRYNLPADIAVQAFQIRQTAQTQADQLRADATLTPEVRQAALTAIQQETGRTLAGTLGNKAYATYQEYSGGWLKELDQNSEPKSQ